MPAGALYLQAAAVRNIKVAFSAKKTLKHYVWQISSYKDSLETQFLVLENSFYTPGIL